MYLWELWSRLYNSVIISFRIFSGIESVGRATKHNRTFTTLCLAGPAEFGFILTLSMPLDATKVTKVARKRCEVTPSKPPSHAVRSFYDAHHSSTSRKALTRYHRVSRHHRC